VRAGGHRLGIDFGTSTTVAVLADALGRVRPLLFDSSPLLASAVYAGPGGDLLTGGDAERAALSHPAPAPPSGRASVRSISWRSRAVKEQLSRHATADLHVPCSTPRCT
jgi:hypothetical protein